MPARMAFQGGGRSCLSMPHFKVMVRLEPRCIAAVSAFPRTHLCGRGVSMQAASGTRNSAAADVPLGELKDGAMKAAKAGAEVVRAALDKPKNVTFKGATDLVTDTDKASEAAILGVLRGAFPEHGFLGEEGGTSGNPASPFLWAVDPLDGTTNFSHGYPSFGVSVAVMLRGQPVAASVVEFGGGPHAWIERTYSATDGGGAFCNGQEIRVSTTSDLTRSLLVTGFGYEHDEPWAANIELFKHFTDVSQGVRRLGAAAIDMCHIALGVADGFWEFRLKPWDMAAGALLVREAGGRVTTMGGDPFSGFSRSVLATNGRLHAAVAERTAEAAGRLASRGIDLSPWFVPSAYDFEER